MFSVVQNIAKLKLPELKCDMVRALGENGQISLIKNFGQNCQTVSHKVRKYFVNSLSICGVRELWKRALQFG